MVVETSERDQLPGLPRPFAAGSRIPARGWAGILLVFLAWPLNWTLSGPRTLYLFFPLWLGYVLVVDSLVFLRTGSSPWTRSRSRFAWLFVISAPLWLLFELLNLRVQNWHYVGLKQASNAPAGILAILCFATVVPAILTTAELVSTFVRRLPAPSRGGLEARPAVVRTLLGTGLAMLALMLIWPRYFYPFLWLSVVFITEPINSMAGFPTLLVGPNRRGWRAIVALCAGGLICGFFWEMWNWHSFPHWRYSVPFLGFWHVFQMPLLGYGGYLPFALEVFALYNLVMGTLRVALPDYVPL